MARGSYAVTGTADATRLQATLHVSEPAHGLLAGLAGLPDLGAVAIDASLDGPRRRGRHPLDAGRRPACTPPSMARSTSSTTPPT